MNGQQIKEKRDELGWSQSELGRRLGVSPQHISKWENGKVSVSKGYERELNELFVEAGISPNEEKIIIDYDVHGNPISQADQARMMDLQDESHAIRDSISNSLSQDIARQEEISSDPPWLKTWDELIQTDVVKDTSDHLKEVDFDFTSFWKAAGLDLKNMSKKDKAKLTDELLGQSLAQIESALGEALSGPSGAKLKGLLEKAVQKGNKASRYAAQLRREYDGAKKSIISKSQKKVMEQTQEISRLSSEAKLLAENAALQKQINEMNAEKIKLMQDKMNVMQATIERLESQVPDLDQRTGDIENFLEGVTREDEEPPYDAPRI